MTSRGMPGGRDTETNEHMDGGRQGEVKVGEGRERERQKQERQNI